MGGKVGEYLAALRAAVFSLSSKNLSGTFKRPPPPHPAGRGLTRNRLGGLSRPLGFSGITPEP